MDFYQSRSSTRLCLGRLLFLVFNNDVVNEIGSNIRLFGDDTSLYIIVDNPHSSAPRLNDDLKKISDWAKLWLVAFNPPKNESLVVSRKVNKPVHPPLFMQKQQIQEVDHHKDLGLYLTNDGSWHKQIQYIKDKAWGRINIMRNLKFTLDRKSYGFIYTIFVRRTLEYCAITWDNCAQYEKDELEKVQHETARIATCFFGLSL